MLVSKGSAVLETDYLIVGAGATGMAFADTMLTETDARMILVDRLQNPGGHWNFAYPFVTLHQPSAFYGVSSTPLGHDTIDDTGYNRGLQNLATGAAISAYYQEIMLRRFIPSGRVRYFPMCTYLGDGRFQSVVSGDIHEVKIRKKTVHANHMKTSVPATHTPNFRVDPDVNFISINQLCHQTMVPAGYVVIGGGKTGIDACLWLLQHGVAPENIRWIISRDAWLTDRRNAQPTRTHLRYFLHDRACQFEALAHADSIADVFVRLENAGSLIRLDPSVQPTMYHGATVSHMELQQLRRIPSVIRQGRVRHIHNTKLVFEKGELPVTPNLAYIDCSAHALRHAPMQPVFEGHTITIQSVRAGQLVFSAALVAHVEAAYPEDDALKNNLCAEIPMPDKDTDWLLTNARSWRNQHTWSSDKQLSAWLYHNRLDGFSHLVAEIGPQDTEEQALLARIRASAKPAMANLQKFVADLS